MSSAAITDPPEIMVLSNRATCGPIRLSVIKISVVPLLAVKIVVTAASIYSAIKWLVYI